MMIIKFKISVVIFTFNIIKKLAISKVNYLVLIYSSLLDIYLITNTIVIYLIKHEFIFFIIQVILMLRYKVLRLFTLFNWSL